MKKFLVTLLFVAAGAAGVAQPAFASAREEARLIEASGVLEELRHAARHADPRSPAWRAPTASPSSPTW